MDICASYLVSVRRQLSRYICNLLLPIGKSRQIQIFPTSTKKYADCYIYDLEQKLCSKRMLISKQQQFLYNSFSEK